MIGIIFELANELTEVRVNGNEVLFKNNLFDGFVPIDNLGISKEGVIKEFPDLEDKENWKEEAINRFKEKIKSMSSEIEAINYIREDLQKYGYKPIAIQREGFRVQKIK